MSENKINVEEIMKEIRENIEKSGAKDIPLSFAGDTTSGSTGSSGDILHEANEYFKTHYQIEPYGPITGNPIKVFIKRAVRKTSSFIVKPIVAQQNNLNFHFWKVSEAVEIQRAQVEDMKRTVAELEEKVALYEKEHKK